MYLLVLFIPLLTAAISGLFGIFTRRGVLTLLPAVEGNIRKHVRLWIDEGEIAVAARATNMVFDFITEAF